MRFAWGRAHGKWLPVRRQRRRAPLRLGLLVSLLALGVRPAAAVPVCRASDVAGTDPGCPPSGPCTITRDVEITGMCAVDFGDRDVTLADNVTISLAPQSSLSLGAASLAMSPGAAIDGRASSETGA